MEVGNINIDFQVINSYDPAVLLVGDFSTWLHIKDKPSIIEITLPGSSVPVTYNFVKNTINAFNSNTLNVTCTTCEDYVDLPDGIYTIILKGSPDTFNKKRYYLKTDRMRLDLDKIYASFGLQYAIDDKEYRKTLSVIEFYIRVAEAHIRRGDIEKASRFYNEAKKMVTNYKNCKNCK